MESVARMEDLLGVLRVKVIRGINLAVRDHHSSDPYVILKWGKQKLKTGVVKKSVNPEWNEELTLCVLDPSHPIHLSVYDKDILGRDDKMGNADIDVMPFIQAVRMGLQNLPESVIVKNIIPSRTNSLAEESKIHFRDGKLVQDIALRLRDVESGEIELQLNWVDLPPTQLHERRHHHHHMGHHG
ncbi:GTPase activating protein 1-like [Wolffia australiana]